jgi:hypothetical protein
LGEAEQALAAETAAPGQEGGNVMVTQGQRVAVVDEPAAPLAWRVDWTAVWVGALAAVAAALLIGLIGAALGAHEMAPGRRITTWSDFKLAALVFSVAGAFFAFVIGGWVAGRLAAAVRSETAMLHGAIVWLVALPMLLLFAALGAGNFFGSWYGGLAGTPIGQALSGTPVDPDAAAAARNGALGAVTALLLGLVGAVIGGWMASGEPMTFGYYRTRNGKKGGKR